jgi:hypothetical protein
MTACLYFETGSMDGQEFVGSWRLTATEAQAPPFLALGTFGADGNVVVSPPPVVPPAPHGPAKLVHTSAGHGAWEATVADPSGNVMATESGTIQATRIIAEAPGTSATAPIVGTPAA